MDIEKLIERMNNHLQSLAAYSDPELAHTLEDAATALSTLQAENAQLRAELENYRKGHCSEGGCAAEKDRDAVLAELEQVKQDGDAAVKDIELIVRRINDCNIKLDDGTTVSSLELGRCLVCKHEETGDCDDGGCIFEWRGPKKEN